RFLAGAALLLAPAIAVWLGGILGAVTMPIPSSLHAYPTSVAARFFGSALVLYAAAFAFQYVTGRRATRVAVWFLVAWAALELTSQGLGFRSISYEIWRAFTSWPGPFRLMTARWMLIDV
ncbi:MAG: hypothetical protein U9Q74_07140, partial [Gemmatimonadota bacterium]|nr:hypothetical protein [Gemmatimonadota bacterium]